MLTISLCSGSTTRSDGVTKRGLIHLLWRARSGERQGRARSEWRLWSSRLYSRSQLRESTLSSAYSDVIVFTVFLSSIRQQGGTHRKHVELIQFKVGQSLNRLSNHNPSAVVGLHCCDGIVCGDPLCTWYYAREWDRNKKLGSSAKLRATFDIRAVSLSVHKRFPPCANE
jgi:hypothetical protein